jgi:cell division transport system permease protein
VIDARDLRRFATAVRSGLRGLRAAPLVFALAVTTMAAGLLVLGTYLLIVQNMRGVLDGLGDDLRVVAFLAPGAELTEAETAELGRMLGDVAGVARVRFISAEAALERLRRDLGPDADVVSGLTTNPLPASFDIEVEPAQREPGALRELVARLGAPEPIADVRYREEWVEGYAGVVRAAEGLGLALGAFLAALLAAIAAGTVRLAVYSRSDEIQIQRLVGAGAAYVRGPFYLEGALQGALAAGIALTLLYVLYTSGLPLLREPLAFLLGSGELRFFSSAEMLGLAALGTFLGILGAALSLVRLEARQA